MEINFVENKLDSQKTALNNNFDLRCKDIMDKCNSLVQERISKREYQDNKAFMLGLIREAKSLASQARHQTDNLQTKYENLDEFYVSRDKFDELAEKQANMEREMNQKFKELMSEYDSEDESQNAESIDDISGELGGDTSKADDAKSRNSLHDLRAKPDLLSKEEEIKSLMSG